MKFNSNRKAKRPDLVVSEERGVRHLHVGGEAIQSAMRLDDPFALELDYTRCMMAFLLFHPRPKDCLMVGLGGGSIPKFLYRRMPGVRTRVVELSQPVITTARSLFNVPADCTRLRVELGDGVKAVHAADADCDLLFVDGFDDGDQIPDLVSEEFYAAAYRALGDRGVMVVNFFGHDRKFDRYLKRIEAAFSGCVVCLDAREDGNVIAFGLKGCPTSIPWLELRRCAAKLEEKLGLPFDSFVSGLRKHNRWTRGALLLSPGED
jgi:spermidine synthase